MLGSCSTAADSANALALGVQQHLLNLKTFLVILIKSASCVPLCLNLLKRRILEFGSHCEIQCESRTEIHFISFHTHSYPFTLDFIHLISFHINSHSISYLFTLSSQSISFRFTTFSQSNSHSISYLFTFHFISFHTPFHKCISHLFTIRCFSFHIFSQFTLFHFISFHRVREKI